MRVSIHAPTRGATLALGFNNLRPSVSIHAPTRGATTFCLSALLRQNSFNPRTHTGCDSMILSTGICAVEFQSTHPHGVRLKTKYKNKKEQKVSIHAPTRGATFCINHKIIRILCFNPRTHTGCDATGKLLQVLHQTFQSTHPHGVRPLMSCRGAP